MEQFKNREDGFIETRNAILKKTIPVTLLAAVVGVFVAFYRIDQPIPFIVYPMVFVLMAFSLGIGLYIGVKRRKGLYDSYLLTVDEQSITREQDNTPTISIPISDISHISRGADGSITIKGGKDTIVVAAQIEGADRLESLLTAIMPFASDQDLPFFQKYQTATTIVTVFLYAVVYLVTDKIILVLATVLLFSILGYSFIEIQRNKNVDLTTKRTMWLLVFVGLSMLMRVYTKLIQ